MRGLRTSRRRSALALALCALALGVGIGAASADPPAQVRVGDLVVSADTGLAPQALSKTTPAPVVLRADGHLRTTDGTRPPAARTVRIEEDRNVLFDTTGYPRCGAGTLQAKDTNEALAACRRALVGEGTTSVELDFPGVKPIPIHSRLLIFNGGQSGGQTTLLIHAYITLPVNAAVVVPLVIRRVQRGRYGSQMVARIPVIAGGSGSVTDFSLRIDKRFSVDGTEASVVSATCSDGKLQSRFTVGFADGRSVHAELIRGCTPLTS